MRHSIIILTGGKVMEERILRRIALASFLSLLAVMTLAIWFSHSASAGIDINNNGTSSDTSDNNLDNKNTEEIYISRDEDIKAAVGQKYIAIIKPENKEYNIQIINSYMEKSLLVTIEGLDTSKLNRDSFIKINQTIKYTGDDLQGIDIKSTNDINSNGSDNTIDSAAIDKTYDRKSKDSSESSGLYLVPEVINADGSTQIFGDIPKDMIVDPVISFTYQDTEYKKNKAAYIEFHTDTVYEPFIYQDNKCIYIALKKPKDVYKKIVVLDAGHGGKDPGAYEKNYNTYEKDINLKILLQLKDILEANNNIKVYYTRLEDETIYLNPRVNLANEVQADLFISIHCNSSESGAANGLEVLYNEKDMGAGFTSYKLAGLLFNELQSLTKRINRGLVPASEMVIVGKSEVPVALIETGFLSNADDYAFLTNSEQQRAIAESIYKAMLLALN